MIKFKILCLICLCIVLSKVIGVEKYSNGTVDNRSFMKLDLKDDNASDKAVKKNEKIRLNDEKFQVLRKAGTENIQLQKNAMQNSFQSVYGQAFVINEPPTISNNLTLIKNKSLPKIPRISPIRPKQARPLIPIKPVIDSLPAIPIKPSVKEQPPIYHFNKRPIVYQCCR